MEAAWGRGAVALLWDHVWGSSAALEWGRGGGGEGKMATVGPQCWHKCLHAEHFYEFYFVSYFAFFIHLILNY